MTEETKNPTPPESSENPESASESEALVMKKIELEVPDGITRGIFVFEIEGGKQPLTVAYGNISLSQAYRLFLEATVGVNTRMVADAVVERLLGAMMPPPEAFEGGMPEMPPSPHVEDDIPDPQEPDVN